VDYAPDAGGDSAVIDLQPLTDAESTPETHDFGREEAMALIDPRQRAGVDSVEDQMDSLIADELFTA
jgi:hypothetical protein